MTISIIAAVSKNGVIGKRSTNSIPWNYSEDMRFFRERTRGATVIMGRHTFESIGSKQLPNRRNIIITRSKIDGVECFTNLREAIEIASIPISLEETTDKKTDLNNIWLIGGSNIYREGLLMADHIYLTLMPEIIEGDELIYFPWINPKDFQIYEYIPLVNENLKPEEYLQVAHYIHQ